MKYKHYIEWVIMAVILVGILCFFTFNYFQSMHDTHRARDVETCQGNIRFLGNSLIHYANIYGSLPASSNWENALHTMYIEEGRNIEQSQIYLKCPADNTTSKTSYQLNPVISGDELKDIQIKEWQNIPLVIETNHFGTHGWVYYTDGRVKSKLSRK